MRACDCVDRDRAGRSFGGVLYDLPDGDIRVETRGIITSKTVKGRGNARYVIRAEIFLKKFENA